MKSRWIARMSWMSACALGPSAIAVAAGGCSSSSNPTGNGTEDSGADTSTPGDAGTKGDSGADAGTKGDTGTTSDTGAPADAGSDATSDADTGTPADATSPTDGGAGDAATGSVEVTETLLFADTADAGAPGVDPNLINPWGIAFSPTGIAWISDNGTGLATLYPPDSSTPSTTVVTVPSPGDAGGTSSPTGQIFNSATAPDGGTYFMGDKFIISTEDGAIAGWQSGANAVLRVDNSASGASYTGLAIVPSSPPILIAANFDSGNIDAFDTSYAPVTPPEGTWEDPTLPAGYAPFNVAVIDNQVFVAYATQSSAPDAGSGQGAVSVFDTSGTLVKSLVPAGGVLDSPWGLAVAPAGWSATSGALLVGNFGDGKIYAFDPTTGVLRGGLVGGTGADAGAPIQIPGLWGLQFQTVSTDAGSTGPLLYFTAGPNGGSDGLYGYLSPVPTPG